MNLNELKTKAQSLKTRINAALDHDRPETFAFTIGVQLGAFRSRVRSYLPRPQGANFKDMLESLDERCFYIESEMIEAMALTREHSMMVAHLKNARQGANLCLLVIDNYIDTAGCVPPIRKTVTAAKNHYQEGTYWTVGEGKGEEGQRDMVHIEKVVDGKLVGYRETDKRQAIEWDQDGHCLTWKDIRWNLGERIR